MKKYSLAAVLIVITALLFTMMSFKKEQDQPIIPGPLPTDTHQKIQVAILLDVSNSMDGLIEQAKAQLWNMASVMGKARCGNDKAPRIEIALYEYGRSNNEIRNGYVKQLSGFTTDLDSLSKLLFSLSTNGGDEYCSQVMFTSLTQLKWDTASANYKVIFIAGNEDFLQGKLPYTTACAEAKKKGVIVNTIYCGNKMDGIREHWNIVGECGTGSYTNINQDAVLEDIETPYDTILFTLNEKLNKTYIAYGNAGNSNSLKQAQVDKMNYNMSKSVAAKRVAVKGKKELYTNTHWDLVDAGENDSSVIARVDMKTLPPNLQNKTRAELKQIVKEKTKERGNIRQEIASVSIKREEYITSEREKKAVANNTVTLESEIEKIIRQQANKFNMRIN